MLDALYRATWGIKLSLLADMKAVVNVSAWDAIIGVQVNPK